MIETIATAGTSIAGGARGTTNSGAEAPAVKVRAEAAAACSGRAVIVADEFVARMRRQGIVRHHLFGDGAGGLALDAACFVDAGQLFSLKLRLLGQLTCLAS